MSREKVAERLQPKEGASGSYGAVRCLGVAVTAIHGHRGNIPHAGLLYRWKKDVRLFEMQTHKDLRDETAREGFVWIEPAFPAERMRLVVRRARLVYERHKENAVPYGFKYRRSSFDEKGGLRLGDGEIGLTCSTIVAAILESEGLPLVDPDTWPLPDTSDKATRQKFLADLRGKDAEHAKLLMNDIEAPRISPEEVVAAAALCPPPGTFDSLQDGAAVVRERIGT